MRLFDAFKDKKERTEPIDNAATFSHRHTWVQPDSFRGALTLQPTHKLHWTTAHAHYSAWANYTSNGLCGRNINCQRAGTLQPKQEPLTTHTCPWTHAPNRPTKPHLWLVKSYNQSHPPPPKHTRKTDELKCQRQLFISNERHRAPLTNWHLSVKCVTLTTARLVRLSKRV